ncbi:MAG: hypothetical protein GF334_09140 [Candidatus Altiarchaeales archaeon]|nr:hypothetical protein [Candidatus Altiarchaeales archaeon]
MRLLFLGFFVLVGCAPETAREHVDYCYDPPTGSRPSPEWKASCLCDAGRIYGCELTLKWVAPAEYDHTASCCRPDREGTYVKRSREEIRLLHRHAKYLSTGGSKGDESYAEGVDHTLDWLMGKEDWPEPSLEEVGPNVLVTLPDGYEGHGR